MTWRQGQATIEQQLRAGELERVTANAPFAEQSLEACEAHIRVARMVVDTDPVGALALAYDAARKALAAMLLAQGLRPTRSGGHIAVTQAITAQLDPPIRIGRRVDGVRRTRNANEYPAAGVSSASTDDAVTGYGFVDWFTLQHYERFDGKYAPPLAVVEIEVPFSGSF
ncbi:MAG: hypothetical protein ACYC6C_13870 [Coriobacteriia bacterium]